MLKHNLDGTVYNNNILLNDNVIQDTDVENKYLKYNQKYLMLKQNMKNGK